MTAKYDSNKKLTLSEAQHPNPKVKQPSLSDIRRAAWIWYGLQDQDTLCLAENRLMKGHKPRFSLE